MNKVLEFGLHALVAAAEHGVQRFLNKTADKAADKASEVVIDRISGTSKTAKAQKANATGKKIVERTVKLQNGTVYTGRWEPGVGPSGLGRYYMANGNMFEGTFVGGRMRRGRYAFGGSSQSFDSYEGTFEGGKFHGRGLLRFCNGRVYEGEFRGGSMHGHGELRFPDGGRYVGDFLDGIRSGVGTMWFPNGDRYEGEWAAAKPHGRGAFYYANGDALLDATFRHGNQVDGRFIDGAARRESAVRAHQIATDPRVPPELDVRLPEESLGDDEVAAKDAGEYPAPGASEDDTELRFDNGDTSNTTEPAHAAAARAAAALRGLAADDRVSIERLSVLSCGMSLPAVAAALALSRPVARDPWRAGDGAPPSEAQADSGDKAAATAESSNADQPPDELHGFLSRAVASGALERGYLDDDGAFRLSARPGDEGWQEAVRVPSSVVQYAAVSVAEGDRGDALDDARLRLAWYAVQIAMQAAAHARAGNEKRALSILDPEERLVRAAATWALEENEVSGMTTAGIAIAAALGEVLGYLRPSAVDVSAVASMVISLNILELSPARAVVASGAKLCIGKLELDEAERLARIGEQGAGDADGQHAAARSSDTRPGGSGGESGTSPHATIRALLDANDPVGLVHGSIEREVAEDALSALERNGCLLEFSHAAARALCAAVRAGVSVARSRDTGPAGEDLEQSLTSAMTELSTASSYVAIALEQVEVEVRNASTSSLRGTVRDSTQTVLLDTLDGEDGAPGDNAHRATQNGPAAKSTTAAPSHALSSPTDDVAAKIATFSSSGVTEQGGSEVDALVGTLLVEPADDGANSAMPDARVRSPEIAAAGALELVHARITVRRGCDELAAARASARAVGLFARSRCAGLLWMARLSLGSEAARSSAAGAAVLAQIASKARAARAAVRDTGGCLNADILYAAAEALLGDATMSGTTGTLAAAAVAAEARGFYLAAASASLQLAGRALALGQPRRALAAADAARSAITERWKSPEAIVQLEVLAVSASRLAGTATLAEACAQLEDVVAQAARSGSHSAESTALASLAGMRAESGDRSAALADAERAAVLARGGRSRRVEVSRELALARACARAGQHDRGLGCIQTAEKILEAAQEQAGADAPLIWRDLRAGVSMARATVCAAQKRWKEAREEALAAARAYRAAQRPLSQLRALGEAANAARFIGERSAARALATYVADMYKAAGNDAARTLHLLRAATVLADSGDVRGAAVEHETVARIARDAGLTSRAALAFRLAGTERLKVGEHRVAVPLLKQAAEIDRNDKRDVELGRDLWWLSRSYVGLELFDEALAAARECVTVRESLGPAQADAVAKARENVQSIESAAAKKKAADVKAAAAATARAQTTPAKAAANGAPKASASAKPKSDSPKNHLSAADMDTAVCTPAAILSKSASITGYLWKKGAVFPTVKKRFFVLCGSLLVYFKTPQSMKAQGTGALDVRGARVCDPKPDDLSKNQQGHAFVVETPKRRWIFSAATAEERAKWMHHLLRASR